MKDALVITGDINGFTQLDSHKRETLIQSTSELLDLWAKSKNARIFRGDSFQMLFAEAGEALKRSLQLRCWLKKSNFSDRVMLDARMAIGVGKVAYMGDSVLDSDGEAFHLSGRGFDMLESDEFLRIVTGKPELDKQLYIICRLLDIIISGWTRGQAEVIYMALEDKTQQQMADELKVVQSAINNRLKLAHWKQIDKTIHYISALIAPNDLI
jgi:hypothetical protein